MNELNTILPGFINLSIINADIELVLHSLNDAKICFLPFPDGISERRGSFLAATQSGSVVASYPGQWQTDRLKQAFTPLEKGLESEELIKLLSNSELLSDLQNKSIEYHFKNTFFDWNAIACEYLRIASLSTIL